LPVTSRSARHDGQLSAKVLGKLKTILKQDDPTDEVGAAWACRKLLPQLLAAHGPTRYSRHETAHRRTRSLSACAVSDMPETTRLAGTTEKWWPEIEGFLELGVTNARTEGLKRAINEIKRATGGLRNQDNYERRILLHSAARRAAGSTAGRGTLLKCEEPACLGSRCCRRRPIRRSRLGAQARYSGQCRMARHRSSTWGRVEMAGSTLMSRLLLSQRGPRRRRSPVSRQARRKAVAANAAGRTRASRGADAGQISSAQAPSGWLSGAPPCFNVVPVGHRLAVRAVVIPVVAGSSPVTHPTNTQVRACAGPDLQRVNDPRHHDRGAHVGQNARSLHAWGSTPGRQERLNTSARAMHPPSCGRPLPPHGLPRVDSRHECYDDREGSDQHP
jgi:Transposase